MACKPCRTKKIKCDRARPVCKNCSQRASHCSYDGERRTRRWTEADKAGGRPAGVPDGGSPGTHGRHGQAGAGGPTASLAPSATATAIAATVDTSAGADCQSPWWTPTWHHHMNPELTTAIFDQLEAPQDEDLLDKLLDDNGSGGLEDAAPTIWMRVGDGDEYTGPSSGISIISDSGLSWVRRHVTDSDLLCETIKDIRNGILSLLRQPKCISKSLELALSIPRETPNIPEAQVLRYIDTYFSTVQVIFPILDRDTFLSQLSATRTDPSASQRPSWLALLNAVLASGCRATHSDETADAFKASGREAWGYFQTALSYQSRLLHGSTDLAAVQATAVMAVFAQGLSSPQRLEYSLSSTASRLAQALGLNRQPSAEWNLTEDEVRERNRVFWAVYCLDKTIALRCGRPAVICDSEISCHFPRGVAITVLPKGEEDRHRTPDFDFFHAWTKLARIAGCVSRLLYSSAALCMPCPRVLATLNRLMQDLDSWLHTIPEDIRPGKPLAKIVGRCWLFRAQMIVLQSSYYYTLCSIFRRASPLFAPEGRSMEHLIDRKSHVTHIEAARKIVLLTKHLDIESFTPSWLIFYYPFTALTTIFVHVVSRPPDGQTKNDIALMETAVGFFGRLEYITSGEDAFTKTGEFVRQARKVTENYDKSVRVSRTAPGSITHGDLMMATEMSLPDFVCEGMGPVEMQDILGGGSEDALDITTSGEAGNDVIADEVGRHLRPDSPNLSEIQVTHSNEPIYSDLAGLLVSPSEEVIHVNWL